MGVVVFSIWDVLIVTQICSRGRVRGINRLLHAVRPWIWSLCVLVIVKVIGNVLLLLSCVFILYFHYDSLYMGGRCVIHNTIRHVAHNTLFISFIGHHPQHKRLAVADDCKVCNYVVNYIPLHLNGTSVVTGRK